MTLINTDIGYGTLDPQTDRSEFISFSGITQNSDGTATLTGVTRGLSDIYPFTASSTMRQSHSGQSRFILSDPPQLFQEYAARRNNEWITGTWGFAALPTTTIACSSASQFCNKTYVDSVANQGAATSTETNGGIVELGTLAEQADSFDGGATKPTVLQTKNSTSTCQVVGSYNIVASSTTGKLDRNCFDQSLAYTLTATTTLSATTSLASVVVFNNSTTTWPGGTPAASTTPTFNGTTAGTVSFRVPDFTLIASTTLTGAVASTTLNIPATGRTDLMIILNIPVAAATTFVSIQFNSDTGNNYAYKTYTDSTTLASGDGKPVINLGTVNNNVGYYYVLNISNEYSTPKMVQITGFERPATAGINAIHEGGGLWQNTTSSISSITVGRGGNLPVGTRISVYASTN